MTKLEVTSASALMAMMFTYSTSDPSDRSEMIFICISYFCSECRRGEAAPGIRYGVCEYPHPLIHKRGDEENHSFLGYHAWDIVVSLAKC